MREKRTFAERSKILKSNETKRKFFLVYEGSSTEVLYFDALLDSGNDVEINPLIELDSNVGVLIEECQIM